jgi:hypothetical protein
MLIKINHLEIPVDLAGTPPSIAPLDIPLDHLDPVPSLEPRLHVSIPHVETPDHFIPAGPLEIIVALVPRVLTAAGIPAADILVKVDHPQIPVDLA